MVSYPLVNVYPSVLKHGWEIPYENGALQLEQSIIINYPYMISIYDGFINVYHGILMVCLG